MYITSNSLTARCAVGWCCAKLIPESPLTVVEGDMSPLAGVPSVTTWCMLSNALRMWTKTPSRLCLAESHSGCLSNVWKTGFGRQWCSNIPIQEVGGVRKWAGLKSGRNPKVIKRYNIRSIFIRQMDWEIKVDEVFQFSIPINWINLNTEYCIPGIFCG